MKSFSDMHHTATSRLGLATSAAHATAMLTACSKPAEKVGCLPLLHDTLATMDATSVPFDVITMTTITKDPVRQCVRCHRVTAIAPENDSEWFEYGRLCCPVCGGGWRSLIEAEDHAA